MAYISPPVPVSLHTIVETPSFLRDAIEAGMTDDERRDLVSQLAATPQAGDLIPGTGGARKLRWRRPGRGKSGGYRVITFFGGPSMPLFLLNVFAKSTKVDLSGSERNELRKLLAQLATEYRKGARKHVKGR